MRQVLKSQPKNTQSENREPTKEELEERYRMAHREESN